MGAFVKGDVVVTPFPFSDLTAAKRRPALVVADLTGADVVLCQITTRFAHDEYAVSLADEDFTQEASVNRATSARIRCSRLSPASSCQELARSPRPS